MIQRRSRASTTMAVLIASTLTLLAGCGGEGADVDEALRSTDSTPFSIVEHEGARHVVGHGITMQLPEGWTDYEPEKDSMDGTSYEWAVGLPADTRPLPAGVQFSMGKEGKGAPFETLPDATRELAELAPGYQLIDEGEADIPGAEQAAFLRVEKDLEFDGETIKVEQLQLMLDMPGGQVSVLRFIAETGKWEEQMQVVYDSLVVAEEASEA
jgi:hypothetical protein